MSSVEIQTKQDFGRIVGRIVSFCKCKGLTQADLLDKSGLNKNLLQDWKTGRSCITEESLRKIAQVLDTSTEELRGEPPRLTAAQSQLARHYAAAISSLQEALQSALVHPLWAAAEWEKICRLGEPQEQRDDGPPHDPAADPDDSDA